MSRTSTDLVVVGPIVVQASVSCDVATAGTSTESKVSDGGQVSHLVSDTKHLTSNSDKDDRVLR